MADMECPNCKHQLPRGEHECPACGLVFSKWRAEAGGPAAPPPTGIKALLADSPSHWGLLLGISLTASLGVGLGYFLYSRAVALADARAHSRLRPPDAAESPAQPPPQAPPAATPPAAAKAVPTPAKRPAPHGVSSVAWTPQPKPEEPIGEAWRLEGSVVDLLRAVPVEGAVLRFSRAVGGKTYEAKTGADGRYAVELPVGDESPYQVVVEHAEFDDSVLVDTGARDWTWVEFDKRVAAARSAEFAGARYKGRLDRATRYDFALLRRNLTDEERAKVEAAGGLRD